MGEPVENLDEFMLCCPRHRAREVTAGLEAAGLSVTIVLDSERTSKVWLATPAPLDLDGIDTLADAAVEVALAQKKGERLQWTIPGSAGEEWVALFFSRMQAKRHIRDEASTRWSHWLVMTPSGEGAACRQLQLG